MFDRHFLLAPWMRVIIAFDLAFATFFRWRLFNFSHDFYVISEIGH